MKKGFRLIATFLLTAVLTTSVASAPVLAKTEKFLATTSKKTYSKTEDGKWYLNYQNKETYNKKGNLTGYSYQSYLEDGSKVSDGKYTATYDKKNRTKTEKSYYDGKLESTTKYAYKKNKITKKEYDANNKYTGKEVTKTTSKKITTTYYNAKNKKYGTLVSTLNKKGEFTKVVRKENGKVTYQSSSTYKKGVCTKVTDKYYDDETGKLSSAYVTTYKKGKESKIVGKSYVDGKAKLDYEMSYSYKGKYTTETYISYSDDYTSKNVVKYKSDKAGNHIKSWEKNYENNKLVSTYTYKYKKYTSGAAKGCVKQEILLVDGVESEKTEYTVKQIKHTVK